MSAVPWSTILAGAEAGLRLAAPTMPLPAAVIAEAALALARILVGQGCAVDCPPDVEARLMPADVPTGENQLAARDRIRSTR